ncbi:hypothetical protein RHSIM_Rhsim05G0209400 [Rhododendron simsii]|uniref:Uncharacterized protein n=1 Tax=Rhododendron simsii TaxID=118357 RepID=A0A834H876_RHOSS|nr:hypothetical protein RHSIM_Rhsim05G0209400 [Rhododendron simsii]
MSAIKILNETLCEDWNELFMVNLAIVNLVLALREKAPPKPIVGSSAAIKAYYERWEHSNRTCLMIMKYTMDNSIKQCVPDNVNAKDEVEKLDANTISGYFDEVDVGSSSPREIVFKEERVIFTSCSIT